MRNSFSVSLSKIQGLEPKEKSVPNPAISLPIYLCLQIFHQQSIQNPSNLINALNSLAFHSIFYFPKGVNIDFISRNKRNNLRKNVILLQSSLFLLYFFIFYGIPLLIAPFIKFNTTFTLISIFKFPHNS